MKKSLLGSAILLFAVSIASTIGTEPIKAQGPAGAGASAVAHDSAPSVNPMNWFKKDSTNSADVGNRSDLEKKLTPRLQTQGLLAADRTATDACGPFIELEECVAALHASHSLGLDFVCLRAYVTGVHTAADVSQCKVADGEKSHSLDKAIHQLKPNVNAKQAARDAEEQSRDDLKAISG